METEPIEQTTSPVEWWIADKTKGSVGPFSLEVLRQRVISESWVWRPGWEDWRKASSLREVDLAETGENRALFSGLLAEKPPPRRMFLCNAWLWGIVVAPWLCFLVGLLFGTDLGSGVVTGLILSFVMTFLCLIADMGALSDADLSDKCPWFIMGLLAAPIYALLRAYRTLDTRSLTFFVCLFLWVHLVFTTVGMNIWDAKKEQAAIEQQQRYRRSLMNDW